MVDSPVGAPSAASGTARPGLHFRIDSWVPLALAAVSWLIGWAAVGSLLEAGPVLWALLPGAGMLVLRGVLHRVARHEPAGSPARIAVLVVHQLLLVVAVALNPFFCIYAFIGYVDTDKHLRGRQCVPGLLVTALTCAFGQSGGVPGLFGSPLLYPALALVNAGIAFVMFQADRQREQELVAREQAAEELARVTGENAALQDQLVAQARATGVAEERARLSREIHDTVAQGLVAVIRQLEAVPGRLDPPAQQRVDAAEEAARDCLLEARRAVAALSPHQLDDRALEPALADLVRRWAREHRIVTELDSDEAPAVVAHQSELLRVAQESLTNIAAHAGATTVRMRLAAGERGTVLEVHDDGTGFDPATVARGRGLDGMAERVRATGGELELHSGAGGTVVRATVPAAVASPPTDPPPPGDLPPTTTPSPTTAPSPTADRATVTDVVAR
ncbi:sensor histidine kinase [Pseudonocardia nematodicida]|uniref:histidine kinase n=1 Tax=Pseudonocardia nematodicida TaxID=1206997 RepID=A0ABV1KCT2_9PSEU